MKKSYIISGIIIVVLIILVFITGSNKTPNSNEPIKIGFVGPLTGSQATYGEGVKEGFDLALSEIAPLQFEGRSVEIIYEDTAGEVKNTVSAIQKLISIDRVSAIIQAGASQEAVAAIPIVQENKIPMYAVVSQTPELTDAGDFIFRGMPDFEILAEKISKLAIDIGYKKAAIITASYNQATTAARDAFKELFETDGRKVVASEDFQKGVSDFKTELTKIKSSGADVVFLNALTAEAAIILRQKNELGLKQLFVSHGAVEDKKIIDVTGSGSEGIIFATFNSIPPQNFMDKIQAKYGFEPRRWNMEGYESALFLFDGLKKANSYDNLGLQKSFSQIKEINGVAGKLYFDEGGNISKGVYIKTIKGGEFVEYKEMQ